MNFLSERLNIFKDVDREIVEGLSDQMVKINTETNSLLFREGDVMDSVYLIQSGQYALFKLFAPAINGSSLHWAPAKF